MDCKKKVSAASLIDDLVVEILSRVPFKSFCRFKCVCKAWLAFSSDPYYGGKLPKIPTGLWHQDRPLTGIQLVSLSPNNEETDGGLTFLPNYKRLELVDCCNGLVLCKHQRSYTFPHICHFIVCNPATREWRMLPVPESHHVPCDPGTRYTTMLAFDPSWSAKSFYVFIFQENVKNRWAPRGINKLEVFSSDLSRWLVDDGWIWTHEGIYVSKPHNFIGGKLHARTSSGEILVVDGLHIMSSGMPPDKLTIKLPRDYCRLADVCFGQSSRSLLCAFPEECGRSIAVFSLDAGRPYKWSLKHCLNMPDVFVRDDNIEFCDDGSWILGCRYHIVAIDLEREVLFLVDKETKKLLSYNISTGKLSKIQNGCLTRTWAYHYYVECYSKLPG